MKDKDYIKGLIAHDPATLKAIYANFAKRIKLHIIKNGGTADDAKDVFQDALMVIYNKAKTPDFELSSQFYTYLFGISKFIWARKRKKKANNTVTIPTDERYIGDSNVERDLIKREQHNIYRLNFKKLGDFCQQILELFYTATPMAEIADTLSLKNEHTARNRKYRCQKELEALIKGDPRFKDFTT